MGVIEVTVEKWKEFNGRETEKTPNWFKVHVGIGASKSLFKLPLASKWVWICLLAEAKKQKSASFKIDLEWAAHAWELKEKDISHSLALLKNRQLLRLNSESTRIELGAESALERERERERERDIEGFDFETVFKEYPERPNQNKSRAFKTLQTSIKDKGDLENCVKAAAHYRSYVELEKLESRFIKQFSTWSTQWQEWVDYTPPKSRADKMLEGFLSKGDASA